MEYKIELHAHTSETSNCGKLPGSQQAQGYAIAGYSTLVITDHISAGRFANGFRRPEDRAEMFLAGWRAARAEGEKWGLHVLLGAEARLVSGDEDFLLLGIEPEHIAPLMLLLDAEPDIFALRDQAHAWGAGCLQAHTRRTTPRWPAGRQGRSARPSPCRCRRPPEALPCSAGGASPCR